MKKYRVLVTALAAAAFLAGCGGSDPGNQNPGVSYTRMVNFGDSTSDVGTYRTQLVGLNGEGLYSINGDFSKEVSVSVPDGLLYTNWTQYLAATLHIAQPCPAETGLDAPPTGALYFMAEAPAFHDTGLTPCTSYAQGGARVTQPFGPGNRVFWDDFQSSSGLIGQLTVPVVTQVANFQADTGGFTSTDLVTVLEAGNDLLINRDVNVGGTVAQVLAAEQAGTITVDQGNATIQQAAAQAVSDMATAGTELANLILTQMVAKGATHVVVVSMPDVSETPDGTLWATAGAGLVVNPLVTSHNLVQDMSLAFNSALATGLGVTGGESSHAEILWVDGAAGVHDQVTNPTLFNLTNVTMPACQLDETQANVTGLFVPARVPIPTALFCTKDTLVTDVDSAMTYLFADTVHPTPYGYRLIAALVAERMASKGWL